MMLLLILLHNYIFQGSDIRVYDVENQWKVRKNITAKSLQWTITDTSLSPNKRLLVSFACSSVF